MRVRLTSLGSLVLALLGFQILKGSLASEKDEVWTCTVDEDEMWVPCVGQWAPGKEAGGLKSKDPAVRTAYHPHTHRTAGFWA